MDDLDLAIAELDDGTLDAMCRAFALQAHRHVDHGRRAEAGVYVAMSARLGLHGARRRMALEAAADALGQDG